MADAFDEAARLRRMLSYDPVTGKFTWRVAPSSRSPVGSEAGHFGHKRDWVIPLGGKVYYARRVAWLLTHGEWPPEHVVPINGDKLDLRLDNLKLQSRAETQRASKVRSTNTSGLRGVSFESKSTKWIASITKDYVRYHLGLFATRDEAAAAYVKAQAGDLPKRGTPIARDPATVRRTRWTTLEMARNAPLVTGWSSYEAIISEIGEPRAETDVLMRVDHRLPLGPGNGQWGAPWSIRGRGKKNYHLARYDISQADYDRMFAEQNGRCCYCGQAERDQYKGKIKQMAVDHDHEDGSVRGLSCGRCNLGIGLLSDDPDLMEKIASDIRGHRAAQMVIRNAAPSSEG